MRNSLRSIDGVREVEVDIDENIASVVVAKSIAVDVLIAATTNIGFPSKLKDAND